MPPHPNSNLKGHHKHAYNGFHWYVAGAVALVSVASVFVIAVVAYKCYRRKRSAGADDGSSLSSAIRRNVSGLDKSNTSLKNYGGNENVTCGGKTKNRDLKSPTGGGVATPAQVFRSANDRLPGGSNQLRTSPDASDSHKRVLTTGGSQHQNNNNNNGSAANSPTGNGNHVTSPQEKRDRNKESPASDTSLPDCVDSGAVNVRKDEAELSEAGQLGEAGQVGETGLGSLEFDVRHDASRAALHVTVRGAAGLPVKDVVTGSSDPYVKLQLLPEKRQKVKTRVLRRTTRPRFHETFTFYGVSRDTLGDTTLHFVVLSFDRFSRDDIIGEVLYPLSAALPVLTNVAAPPLSEGKSDGAEEGLQSKGCYEVKGETDGTVASDEVSVVMEIMPRHIKMMHNHSRGELLVSLCYQPAANRLTVVVLKARNLPKMDVTGLSDPYVKIYLLYNGQRIAKKKTHVKKRTLTPVFNESFLFDVPAAGGASGGDGAGGLHNISLEFLALDWDRMTKNEVIGRLEIGAHRRAAGNHGNENDSAAAAAMSHWSEVINCPRKQIAEWHKLTE